MLGVGFFGSYLLYQIAEQLAILSGLWAAQHVTLPLLVSAYAYVSSGCVLTALLD